MKKFGFTVIELVVVIVIIGFLSTIILVAFLNVRQHNRDLQRVNDMATLRNTLAAYYRDEGHYPTVEQMGPGQILAVDNLVYLNKIPSNPRPRDDGECPNDNYVYNLLDEGKSYSIIFCLGSQAANLLSGVHLATPLGFY